MKTVDTKRRSVLKGALVTPAIIALGSHLHATQNQQQKALVLLNHTPYASAFLEGMKQANTTNIQVKYIDILHDYHTFTSLMITHLKRGTMTSITGLLSEADYQLTLAYFQSHGINLKAEIFHQVSHSGTRHHITTAHTATNVISNAKRTLDQSNQWAFLSGHILSGTSAPTSCSTFNHIDELTLSRDEQGHTNLISFLATISKEKQYV
ncbi:hypothetical protein [Sulfurospirillum sp. 1612]|uniref:hypothetical protein n=1 Tax=Sulfurospirillum sp. 1612 TaxID=3094835 RepID=UPI002F936945